MNAFLQSMLGKSTEEISYNSTMTRDNPTKIDYARSSWIKKLGTSSPKNYQIVSSPKLSISSIESRFQDNIVDVPKKVPVMFHPPATPLPDLETIIREFENNFLSPTKPDTQNTAKDGNFVRKIVAAFEDKYKAYNDSKIEEDVKMVLDNRRQSRDNKDKEQSRSRFSLPTGSPKRRTNLFGSSPKIFNESITVKEQSKMSVSFSSPREKRNDGQKNTWISIFSSPFKYAKDNKLSHNHTFTSSPKMKLEEEEDRHRGNSSWDLWEMEELSDSRFECLSSPFKTSDDETKSIRSVNLSLTYDLEDSTLLEVDVCTIEESTMIVSNDEDKLKEENRQVEKTEIPTATAETSKGSRRVPKIIGAFLKKPIEVEKTSVDWIPIAGGKKLPRKRSLKKLLSMLTRNKSSEKKRAKIFSSERNINEEPRELQDSGYDEKSTTSTSSLKSLASISEILLHQDHSDEFDTRRCNGSRLRTFQTRNSLNHVVDNNENEDREETIKDDREDKEENPSSRVNGKKRRKLRLTEVPREIVTQNLGPCYPSRTSMMTMSLDRRSHTKSNSRSKLSRQAHLAHMTKHPLVSITRMEETPREVDIDEDYERSYWNDQQRKQQQPKTDECIYDVPRRYLSKSEPEINETETNDDDKSIYDMPKLQTLPRPTSSIYEDALSLKRRLDYLPMLGVPNFYSVSDDDEPHYATIKRGTRRVHYPLNRQIPTSSCNDLRAHELTTAL